jgi:hypothetical protein
MATLKAKWFGRAGLLIVLLDSRPVDGQNSTYPYNPWDQRSRMKGIVEEGLPKLYTIDLLACRLANLVGGLFRAASVATMARYNSGLSKIAG